MTDVLDRPTLRVVGTRRSPDGDLPPGADVAALSSYLMAIIQGMSVQAASGATRDALYAIVVTTLRADFFGGSTQRRFA